MYDLYYVEVGAINEFTILLVLVWGYIATVHTYMYVMFMYLFVNYPGTVHM